LFILWKEIIRKFWIFLAFYTFDIKTVYIKVSGEGTAGKFTATGSIKSQGKGPDAELKGHTGGHVPVQFFRTHTTVYDGI
jgi:hypothetical protein